MSHGSKPPTVALMLEPDGPGGAEKMLLLLAEELRERGFGVCPVGPKVGLGWLADQFQQRGFEPETFHLRRPIDVGCLRGLVEVLRRRMADVVHGHDFTMAVYGAAATAVLRRPLVITMHGDRSYQDRWRRRVALRWAIRRSVAAVAVSEATREELERTLRLRSGEVRVIPNGIRPQRGQSAPVKQELGLREHELLLLNVGNLYPVKGHAILLCALARVRERRPDLVWRLAIAGRGKEREALEAGVGALDLRGRVHLLGHRDDVADLLAAADVFVLPSLSEGLPLALLEAMSAGKAIVATAVGGIPEVLHAGQDSLIVPAGDPDSLADALEHLLTDGGLRQRIGIAARRIASERYTAGRMTDRYAAIYRLGKGGCYL